MSLDSPEETRPFEGGTGRMKVVMDGGEEMEYGRGISPSCHPARTQGRLRYLLEGWQHDAD
jgi:hypothetical protein